MHAADKRLPYLQTEQHIRCRDQSYRQPTVKAAELCNLAPALGQLPHPRLLLMVPHLSLSCTGGICVLAVWSHQSVCVCAGSTQEEMGALVQQSINDSKISGGDRPVAWDGETRAGAGLQNQLKQIQDSKVQPSIDSLAGSGAAAAWTAAVLCCSSSP